MAKTKPQEKVRRSKGKKKGSSANGAPQKPKASPEQLVQQAIQSLHEAQPDEALIQARRALALLQPTEEPTVQSLPVLNLLGEICIELGDADTARDYFLVAVALDPEGEIPEEHGGGSEKFLWLAQLCEEGGAESVEYFDQGAVVLRRQIAVLEGKRKTPETEAELQDKKHKLANALCGVIEVYMTDLSWEEDAESRCEALVTEAMLVAPNIPEVLQTLANVRLSQSKTDDARSALNRSLEIWKDLPPEDEKIPGFPTRISLARLLMEAGMLDEAIEVLERLVTEDDHSVEAWYLGGWCLHLISEQKKEMPVEQPDDAIKAIQKASRDWLQNSQKMYKALEYEDERLRDHAQELIEDLNKTLGPPVEDEEDADEEWEDEGEASSDDEDESMEGT